MPLSYADRETTYALAAQFRQLADALDRLAERAREDGPERGRLQEVVANLAEVVEVLRNGERQGSVSAAEIGRIGGLFGEIGRVLRDLGENRSA